MYVLVCIYHLFHLYLCLRCSSFDSGFFGSDSKSNLDSESRKAKATGSQYLKEQFRAIRRAASGLASESPRLQADLAAGVHQRAAKTAEHSGHCAAEHRRATGVDESRIPTSFERTPKEADHPEQVNKRNLEPKRHCGGALRSDETREESGGSQHRDDLRSDVEGALIDAQIAELSEFDEVKFEGCLYLGEYGQEPMSNKGRGCQSDMGRFAIDLDE